VVKYIEYYIRSIAANDPQAYAAAKIDYTDANIDAFRNFRFDREVRVRWHRQWASNKGAREKASSVAPGIKHEHRTLQEFILHLKCTQVLKIRTFVLKQCIRLRSGIVSPIISENWDGNTHTSFAHNVHAV
jgi:hypothetical protein